MRICRRSVFLLIFMAFNAFGQKAFLITNNDSFRRPNSVSTYAIQADGSLLRVGQFATGGTGGGNSGDPSGQGIGFITTTRLVVTPEIELKSLKDQKEFQESKVPELLSYLEKNSKFYSAHFKKHNISISDIKTLEDLQKIPVTTKDDIQQHN